MDIDPNQAVVELATDISIQTVNSLGGDEVERKSFLPILIGLLPVLADLLAKNCQPENAAGLRNLAAKPIMGRVLRNRIRRAVSLEINDRDDWRAFGETLAKKTEVVLLDAENDALVTAAMQTRPAPIWGLYGGV